MTVDEPLLLSEDFSGVPTDLHDPGRHALGADAVTTLLQATATVLVRPSPVSSANSCASFGLRILDVQRHFVTLELLPPFSICDRSVRSAAVPVAAGINYDRRGSGTPLVLIHGIGSRWQVWRPVLDQLSARHDVIAVDLPGFGDSPRPAPGTRAGVPSLTSMLEAFLAELELERPHVAGNSLGGWLTLELARRDAVASATALDPGGFLRGADNLYTIPLLVIQRLGAQASLPLAPRLFASATGRRLGWSGVVAHPERMTPQDAVLGVGGMARAPWFWGTLAAIVRDGFRGGSEINVPVTIAWGTQDRLLLPHLAVRALEQIPAARFVSLPDCGHVPMYDDPTRVADTILQTCDRA